MRKMKHYHSDTDFQVIVVRPAETIYQAHGAIENGTFSGRWHFSFGDYHDRDWMQFGNLRVFNDDTLSPGAVWPLHPHREIEVVTYCAAGEFRHADEHGKGGVLKKGDVQHTTVGSGMRHSEINERDDSPMRFIQMWFVPSQRNLPPAVQQRAVARAERTNRLLPLVSNDNAGALRLHSDAAVSACFLEKDRTMSYPLGGHRGGYLYVLEGGPVELNGSVIDALGAARITGPKDVVLTAGSDTELLFVETALPNETWRGYTYA